MTELLNKVRDLDESRIERANLAVSIFRGMLPGLQSYARSLTGNDRVRLVLHEGPPMTDGLNIFYRPPIELADAPRHTYSLCDKRDERDLPICPACRVNEKLNCDIVHEIGHIVGQSMEELSSTRARESLFSALQQYAPDMLDRVKKDMRYRAGMSWKELSGWVSPFLPNLLNALDDARVDAAMFQARAGLRRQFAADIKEIFVAGADTAQGVKLWRDADPDSQVMIGCFLKASGYDYASWLAPQVVEALDDEEISRRLDAIIRTKSPAAVFNATMPVFVRLRELGWLLTDEEREEANAEAEETPDEEGSESGEGSEGESQDSEGDSSAEGSPEGDVRSDQESGGDESDSEVSGDGPGGDNSEEEDGSSTSDNGGERPDKREEEGDEDLSEGTRDDSKSERPAGDSSDQASGDESGDETQADEGEVDESRGQTESTDQGSGEPTDEADSDDSGGAEDSGEEGGEDRADGLRGEGSIGDQQESGGDADGSGDAQGGGSGSGQAGQESDPTEITESSVAEDEVAGADDSSDASGEDLEAEETGEDQVLDTGAYDDEMVVRLDTVEEALAQLDKFRTHEVKADKPPVPSPEDELDEAAVDVAIIQSLYFEKPSAYVNGVKIHVRDEPLDERGGWRDTKYGVREGKDGDFKTPESVIGKSLAHTRRVFGDNKRTGIDRNRKSGRVDTRVLGKRAPLGDPRIFGKKTVPKRRSYKVILGIDISGSQMGANLVLTKAMVYAQAELLFRAGVDFAIYAHTAQQIPGTRWTEGLTLDVYVIKEFNQSWDPKSQESLSSIQATAENLDGHGVEFYRKIIEKEEATDKLILYYTDGKMPAANYQEELEILQREIKYCKQRKINLLGVGIRTDSPKQHGLDTVIVNSIEDMPNVLTHLENNLLRG